MNDLQMKKHFPIFTTHPKLAFLDNAATTQKPEVMMETQKKFYETTYANIHRATYDLAAKATEMFEGVRQNIADFVGAASPHEIVFVRNASEALNLAAFMAGQNLRKGDELLVSVAGHHSNGLPWMRLAKEKNLQLHWIGVTKEGRLDVAGLKDKLSAKTKVVALEHVSNVLGYVNPIADISEAAHTVGAIVVVDSAQSSCRMPTDVQKLGADFIAFSGHKMYGPTGVGWLWARREILQAAEPMLAGGGTIVKVTQEEITWADTPFKFEAGTPDIAGVVAMGGTIDFLRGVGLDAIWEHDQEIMRYALPRLQSISGLKLFGAQEPVDRAAIFSFLLRGIHSHDVVEICNERQIAIRGGHHCAQPLMAVLDVEDVNRASFGMYNTKEDVDRLVEALVAARDLLTEK